METNKSNVRWGKERKRTENDEVIKKLLFRTGGVAQVVEHLPSKCEALSSNPRIVKQQQEQQRQKKLLLVRESSLQGGMAIPRNLGRCNNRVQCNKKGLSEEKIESEVRGNIK
jgi:hypothetical protein